MGTASESQAIVIGAGFGGLALAIRELAALRSLARLDDLRERAAAALVAQDDRAAGKVADDLLAAMAGNARTARGRAAASAASRAVRRLTRR